MGEASFNIRANTEHGEQVLVCNGANTELYIHQPQYEEVDHIFHRIDDTDRRLGGFVWRHILGEEEFERIALYMHETGDFMITYRPEPTEHDFEEYLHSQAGDIDSWQG